ncbi:MAG: molybdopterin molybdotransferase MoeA [Urechidicola sp.]|nr:molybdopterin molybdotransferase MoeA [Urechidicola sp.]
MKLTSTYTALEIILNQSKDFGIEEVEFINSLGRVLKENIVADRDFPPFNRVSMDGIGICFDSFKNGQRKFKIEGVQPAGSPQLTLKNPKNCIEVMTGAMLPKNIDVVIPYEQVSVENSVAMILIEGIEQFKNIHKKGTDKQYGDLIISTNTLISSSEIGVLATVGKSKVKVAKQPKVLIISTGDELVEVDELPTEYQIRRSNVYTLVSLLERLNIYAETAHISDDKKVLKLKIATYLKEFDVLLFSGAVSKGKFDFIPEVLDELGVEKLFHKVAQRPGKPFWFGRKVIEHSRNDRIDKIVFAFPGNPISTFVSCVNYFYPWYQKSVGIEHKQNFAVLATNFTFKPELTYFLQVKLENIKGVLYAHPIAGKGSGDLANLVQTDAFLELPADRREFKKGEVFPILKYRSF